MHYETGKICTLRYDLAQQQIQKIKGDSLESSNSAAARLTGYAKLYHALGQKKNANDALAEFKQHFGETHPFKIASIQMFRGETNLGFEWLEKAFLNRDRSFMSIKHHPDFQSCRNDQRYASLLKKMNLPL